MTRILTLNQQGPFNQDVLICPMPQAISSAQADSTECAVTRPLPDGLRRPQLGTSLPGRRRPTEPPSSFAVRRPRSMTTQAGPLERSNEASRSGRDAMGM